MVLWHLFHGLLSRKNKKAGEYDVDKEDIQHADSIHDFIGSAYALCMPAHRSTWTWSPPRPPWMVIGVVSTSAILSLGGFLISMALTYNTRYEQLGIMVSLVLVLIVVAVMIEFLRRKIVRLRLETGENGLRWTNLNQGQVRLLPWDDILRFQIAPLHRHGQISRHELRLWTRASRAPLVVGQDMDDPDRHKAFMQFTQDLGNMLKSHGIDNR